MPSEFDDCLVELMDAQDETCGKKQGVFIEGQFKRAIIEEITTDEILISGGNAESGGFRAKCRKADFSEQPQQGDEIWRATDDRRLSILSVIERNGCEYEITAGDMTAESR